MKLTTKSVSPKNKSIFIFNYQTYFLVNPLEMLENEMQCSVQVSPLLKSGHHSKNPVQQNLGFFFFPPIECQQLINSYI